MKRSYIISVLLLSYVFFLVVNIPASRVLNFLQKQGSLPVSFYGIEGSIWRGHADSLVIPGNQKLENLDWSINPFALLLGRLSTDIKATIQKQPLSGQVSKHFFGGDLFIYDATSKLPAKTVQTIIDLPIGEMGGDIEIFIDKAHLKADLMPLVEARIFWQHAKLTLGQTINMGQINITVIPNEAHQTIVNLSNNGGDLSLNGEASIGTDHSYVLNIGLKPKDATGDVAQSLNLFAQRQSDGSYKVKQNGNLRQLGF